MILIVIMLAVASSLFFSFLDNGEEHKQEMSSLRYSILDSLKVPHVQDCIIRKKVVYDSSDSSIANLFALENACYIIRFNHSFDTLSIPQNSEIYFDGGSISGNIFFNNTYLSGKIRLQNTIANGRIANTIIHSGWFCFGDGLHDDAININSMINICDSLVFQEGTYLLSGSHIPSKDIEISYHSSVKSHIGIYQSNKHLYGDGNVVFLTKDKMSTCCIYSKPNDIDGSISNLSIRNISFRVENDGETFNEYFHTIKIVGVNGLIIENCKFLDYWGDAICLSHYGDNAITGERTRNSNVLILNNVINGGSRNNRNGISIINGKNVKINRNSILETSKKSMPGAIDIEPNNSAYTVDDIVISNNEIYGSNGAGVSLVSMQDNAPLHNIYVFDNIIKNVVNGILVYLNTKNSTSNFIIENNIIENVHKNFHWGGQGSSDNWVIRNNSKNPSISEINSSGLSVSNLRVN